MKKTLTQSTATPGQLRQITRVGTDALEKAITEFGMDKDGAQRVHAQGDEFAEAIRMAVIASLKELSVSNQYEDEEVESLYGYLSGYKPKGLTEQCNQLRVLFPGIGFCNHDLLAQIDAGKVALPENAEGWFVIPNWMKNQKIFGETYGEALQKVLDTISLARNGRFVNYREGQLDETHLRQTARTKKFFQQLAKAQGDPDILIVPAQFGIRHRSRSVRRARVVFLANECGLGAFAIGIMLLTHPERLANYDDLYIDCAGDEFSPDADGVFSAAPVFYYVGSVEFYTRFVHSTDGSYGSASAFLPQS